MSITTRHTIESVHRLDGPPAVFFVHNTEPPLNVGDLITLDQAIVRVVDIEYQRKTNWAQSGDIVGLFIEPYVALGTPPIHGDWSQVPEELRIKCVDHLRNNLTGDEQAQVREAMEKDPTGWWVDHHFGWGMGIRNLLREVVKDAELPGVDYGDGELVQNWDDYYPAAVEEAVR